MIHDKKAKQHLSYNIYASYVDKVSKLHCTYLGATFKHSICDTKYSLNSVAQ